MNFDLQSERERDFVNQFSLVFEHAGLPPISGRIVGRLLMCDPPHQSSTDLADYLQASRGAISTSTRTLIQIGLVELVRFPADRKSYFRVRDGCWPQMMLAEQMRVRRLRELGDSAVDFLSSTSSGTERAKRVQQLRDFNAFLETEFPLLLEHWENRSKP